MSVSLLFVFMFYLFVDDKRGSKYSIYKALSPINLILKQIKLREPSSHLLVL